MLALLGLLLADPVAPVAPPPQRVGGAGAQDPYTRGEPQAMRRAGYRSFGPFRLFRDVTSAKVDEALGDVGLHWLETEHFRIGCSLGTMQPNGSRERQALAAELDALRNRLPGVPRRPSRVDPWLRAHLWAARAERTFERFAELVCPDPERDARLIDAQRSYVLLLFADAAQVGRFRDAFLGPGLSGEAFRWSIPVGRVELYATHGAAPVYLESELALRCNVTYALTRNLLDGYRGHGFPVPAWLSVGLGHYLAREISPRYDYFAEDRDYGPDDVRVWDWPPRVRARVSHGMARTGRALAAPLDDADFSYADHMMAWSRVDHLVRTDPAGFARFVHALKAPFGPDEEPITVEALQRRQWQALRESFGWTPEEWDEAWREWVLATYPRR